MARTKEQKGILEKAITAFIKKFNIVAYKWDYEKGEYCERTPEETRSQIRRNRKLSGKLIAAWDEEKGGLKHGVF